MTPIVSRIDKATTRLTCQSKMLDPMTRSYGHFDCDRNAAFIINGTPMCKRHAGSLLVDLLADSPPTEEAGCHQ